jgi:ABC-type nitrate/sulfonate/bicarbonate transport system substrate-binding protein
MVTKGNMIQTPSGLWIDRRSFLRMGGLGLIGTIVAACGGGATTTTAAGATTATAAGATTTAAGATTTAAGATTTAAASSMSNLSSLVLGINNPNYATQLPIYIAQAKGWLDEVGITGFEPITTDEYLPGLIGGSIDITQGDTDVIFGTAEASGEAVIYLGTYRDHEWRILGARAGIATFEDLRGGTITGGQTGSRNEFLMREIVAANGLDPDTDVTFVPMGGSSDARLQALLAGQVDAANIFPRHKATLLDAGGILLAEDFASAPQEGVAAMGDWLADNADAAVAYLTANIKARQYMQDIEGTKDEIIQIMIDAGFDVPPEFIDLYDVEVQQVSPDGGFDVGEMEDLVIQMTDLGLLPEGILWRDHVDMTYMWAAQEANGLPKRPDPADLA